MCGQRIFEKTGIADECPAWPPCRPQEAVPARSRLTTVPVARRVAGVSVALIRPSIGVSDHPARETFTGGWPSSEVMVSSDLAGVLAGDRGQLLRLTDQVCWSWGSNPAVRAIYPDGIHATIAAGLGSDGMTVSIATLDQDEHGLGQARLQETHTAVVVATRSSATGHSPTPDCGIAESAAR
jgi:hypothetical protein